MMPLKWVFPVTAVLVGLPVIAAYFFPINVFQPVPVPPALVLPHIAYHLPPSQPNDLTGAVIKKQRGLVNLSVNAHFDTPGAVLHSFIAVLQTYPHVRQVRVSWSMLLMMNESNSTALYDRRRHTIAFFSQEDGDLGSSRNHVLFSAVPEAVFVPLANARLDSDETPWGSFDGLPKFGCRKRDLGSWQKPRRTSL